MGDIRVIADHRGQSCVIMRRWRRRSHRGSISRCLGSFWLRFSLMWAILTWSWGVVRRHTTSCDVEAHRTMCNGRATSYSVVRWSCVQFQIYFRTFQGSTTSSRIVRHRTTVVRSYDCRTIYLQFHRHVTFRNKSIYWNIHGKRTLFMYVWCRTTLI